MGLRGGGGLPDDRGDELRRYLDSLDRRRRESIASLADRLATITEREAGRWLEPQVGVPSVDLEQAISAGSVVYVELDANRQPETARLLAGAIVEDLIVISERLQRSPVPAVICLDEFGLLGAARVLRLYQAARGAGMSTVALTQSMADLDAACRAGGLILLC